MLNEKEIKTLEEIASSHNMTVQELGNYLNFFGRETIRKQISLSDEELRIIDERRKEVELDRSKYCIQCCKKALQTEFVNKINIRDIMRKSESEKRNKISISIYNQKDYDELVEVAGKLGVKLASMIRYFCLNVKL